MKKTLTLFTQFIQYYQNKIYKTLKHYKFNVNKF